MKTSEGRSAEHTEFVRSPSRIRDLGAPGRIHSVARQVALRYSYKHSLVRLGEGERPLCPVGAAWEGSWRSLRSWPQLLH